MQPGDPEAWEVLDLYDLPAGTPVPGDPEALSSLASRLLNQADQARDSAQRLTSVQAANEGTMQGDYAESFQNVLSGLSPRSSSLSEAYQSAGQALNGLSGDLQGLQTQAQTILEQGTQADGAYRQAAAELCETVPGVSMTGVTESGPVWRGLTAAWAESAASGQDQPVPEIAASCGAAAEAAEMDRQEAVAAIQQVISQYEDTVSQCSQAVQDAMPALQQARTGESVSMPPAAAGQTPAAGSGTGPRSSADPGSGRDMLSAGDTPGASRDPEEVPDCADPVDVATGDVILTETDVSLPGVLPLILQRRHRSSWRTGRWHGRSWMSSFDQRLQVSADRVTGAFADGRILRWPMPGDLPGSTVTAVTGPPRVLRRGEDDSWTVTDERLGLTWRFEPRAGYARSADGRGELPLTEVTDRAGHTISFAYGSSGQPVAVTHSGGYRVEVTTENGHVTALALAASAGPGRVLARYSYDRYGNLAEVTNSSGRALRFSYDDSSRLTGWRDRNDQYYRYSYDDRGRCTAVEGPGGVLSGTFGYEGALTRWTDISGAVTAFEITADARLAALTDPLGHTTRLERDPRGKVTARTDALGRTTRYAWDVRGNLTAITRPDGTRETAGYDDRSQLVTLTAADGGTWQQDYDGRGNRTSLTAPDGTVTAFGYDDGGHLASVTAPDGTVTQVACDGAGLPVTVTAPGGATTTYDLDPAGRITRVTGPDGAVTSLDWTPEGRPAARTFADGTTETWDWDGEGNLTRHVSPAGKVTSFDYGPFDKPTAAHWPDGTVTALGYDHALRLTEVRHSGPGRSNGTGLAWRYDYDAAGCLTAETDYNGATTTYGYDPAGQLTRRVNAAGQETTYGYDLLGNLTGQTSGEAVTTFGYDPAGRLTRARNPDADIAFTRDQLGRITAETCDDRTLTTSYDPAGRITGRVTPSGAATSWTYDPAGMLAAMTAGGQELRFGHDPAGRETSRELPGGLILTSGRDPLGRLTAQVLTGPGEDLQRRAYTYSPDGFVTGIEDLLAGNRTVDLDDTGRVTGITGPGWAERYGYDPLGNITAAAWPALPPQASGGLDSEPQGPREVAGTLTPRAGNVRYGHDAAGRVITRTRTRLSRKPETWRYEWNADDRLTAVTEPDGSVWRYAYDPFGRRIAKRHDDANGQILGQTRFAWDGVILAEEAEDGGEVTTWDYRPGSFEPLAQTSHTALQNAPQDEIDQRFHAIITDLAGTPSELVAPDGTLAGHQRQTLWGGTAWDPGGASTPLRFPGQYADDETGLHYNNQRYYDPATGSYLSPDPLGLAPALNPHAYVSNPHVLMDPLGLTADDSYGEGPGETYYRTMSSKDYASLRATGNLPATKETFISPTKSFSSDYEGTMVKFTLKPGTTDSLSDIGSRDSSAITTAAYPDMPLISKGWTKTSAFFKGEGDQINIGLGRGSALNVFNDAITSFEEIPK